MKYTVFFLPVTMVTLMSASTNTHNDIAGLSNMALYQSVFLSSVWINKKLVYNVTILILVAQKNKRTVPSGLEVTNFVHTQLNLP